jgi:hypothetical protein
MHGEIPPLPFGSYRLWTEWRDCALCSILISFLMLVSQYSNSVPSCESETKSHTQRLKC